MREISIRLTSLEDVKAFVDAAIDIDCAVEVVEGEQAVDARSITEVLNLDLKQPLQVAVIGAASEVAAFCSSVSRLIVA